MTLATIRTKAEQALLQHFEAFRARPEASLFPDLRQQAIGVIAAQGLPSRRNEAWKYTDLRERMTVALAPVPFGSAKVVQTMLVDAIGSKLAELPAATVIVYNGQMVGLAGPEKALPDVKLEGLAASRTTPSAARIDDPAVALNLAFATDGAVLSVVAGQSIRLPIHIVYLSDINAPAAINTRSVIEIGKGAEVTILESHVSLGKAVRQTNHVAEIRVADGAKVEHLKFLGEGPSTQHISTWLIDLGAHVDYFAFQFSPSPGLARNQAYVTYGGRHTTATFNAAFLVRGHEHVDTTLVIDHAVPNCTSRELVKGVLDGASRGVFQGKVIVRPDAQKSDGKQMAKSLMLSETAEFDSKPELEIHADDVVCGHGSTAAQIDDEQLFYLRARGIPNAQARALLVEAFVGEVLETIPSEQIRDAFLHLAARWLTA